MIAMCNPDGSLQYKHHTEELYKIKGKMMSKFGRPKKGICKTNILPRTSKVLCPFDCFRLPHWSIVSFRETVKECRMLKCWFVRQSIARQAIRSSSTLTITWVETHKKRRKEHRVDNTFDYWHYNITNNKEDKKDAWPEIVYCCQNKHAD